MSLKDTGAFSSTDRENSLPTNNMRTIHAQCVNRSLSAVDTLLPSRSDILYNTLRTSTTERRTASVLSFASSDNQSSRSVATDIASSVERSCHELTMTATEDNDDDDRESQRTAVSAHCRQARGKRQTKNFFFGVEHATDVDAPLETTKNNQKRMMAICRQMRHEDFASSSSAYYYNYCLQNAFIPSMRRMDGRHLSALCRQVDAQCIHSLFNEVIV